MKTKVKSIGTHKGPVCQPQVTVNMTTKVSIEHRISYHRYVELIKVQTRVKALEERLHGCQLNSPETMTAIHTIITSHAFYNTQ